MIHQEHTSQRGGFTLIEILVSMGVLGVIITIGISMIVVFASLQRRTINAQNALDNIRFAVDSMARDMRTGDKFCQADDCEPNPTCSWSGGGCTVFSFRQKLGNNDIVRYQLNNGVVETWRSSRPTWLPLTDPQRTVTKLRFYVRGAGVTPEEQQRVTILMEVQGGVSNKPGEIVTTQVQTTVTKRKLR